MSRHTHEKHLATIAAVAVLVGQSLAAQKVAPAGRDLPYLQGDPGGTRFSTLTQINTDNVATLQRAWTFHTGSGRVAMSPMVVERVMYFSSPNGVYALDGVTGQQIWKYAPASASRPVTRTRGRCRFSCAFSFRTESLPMTKGDRLGGPPSFFARVVYPACR